MPSSGSSETSEQYILRCFPRARATRILHRSGDDERCVGAYVDDAASGWRIVATHSPALEGVATLASAPAGRVADHPSCTWTRFGLDTLWDALYGRDCVLVIAGSPPRDGRVVAGCAHDTHDTPIDKILITKGIDGRAIVQIAIPPQPEEWSSALGRISRGMGEYTSRRRIFEDCEAASRAMWRAQACARDIGAMVSMQTPAASLMRPLWSELQSRVVSGFDLHLEDVREKTRARKRAREAASHLVDSNLRNIKARLWRPDGQLMRRRFASGETTH